MDWNGTKAALHLLIEEKLLLPAVALPPRKKERNKGRERKKGKKERRGDDGKNTVKFSLCYLSGAGSESV